MINLYLSTETNFTTNGLVVLSDCKTAYIEEMLNDKYEVTIEYPIDSRGKWQYLVNGNIIKMDGQLFRIYNTVVSITGVKVTARHIFYDLINNFVQTCNIVNANANSALNAILTNTQYAHLFTATSTMTTLNSYSIDKNNPIESIMGSNGLISIYGGEIIRDNFSINLPTRRGADNGVTISYGKNIIGIEETLNMDSLCTRIMPIGKGGLLLPEVYADSANINSYPHPVVKSVTFSNVPDVISLRTTAQAYLVANSLPIVNYKVDFIELNRTMDYKNYSILETVSLGDTVTIKHTLLNINLKVEVIRIKKNELTGRIEEVEIGVFKPNLAQFINNSNTQIVDTAKVVNSDIFGLGTHGGNINTGLDHTTGVSPDRAAIRLVPGTNNSKPSPGYLQVLEDGSIYFYKDDGTGNPFAYIKPDGTTNLISSNGGGEDDANNYFIHRTYYDTITLASVFNKNAIVTDSYSLVFPDLANFSVSDIATIPGITNPTDSITVTLT